MPKKRPALCDLDDAKNLMTDALNKLIDDGKPTPAEVHLRRAIYQLQMAALWIGCPDQMRESVALNRTTEELAAKLPPPIMPPSRNSSPEPAKKV